MLQTWYLHLDFINLPLLAMMLRCRNSTLRVGSQASSTFGQQPEQPSTSECRICAGIDFLGRTWSYAIRRVLCLKYRMSPAPRSTYVGLRVSTRPLTTRRAFGKMQSFRVDAGFKRSIGQSHRTPWSRIGAGFASFQRLDLQ